MAPTAVVALVVHWFADPVRGVGIAVPVFLPALITAVLAVVLARERADLTNLDKVSDLGAPVASIGGAGTFDGIFVTRLSRCRSPASGPGGAGRRRFDRFRRPPPG